MFWLLNIIVVFLNDDNFFVYFARKSHNISKKKVQYLLVRMSIWLSRSKQCDVYVHTCDEFGGVAVEIINLC